MVILASVAVLCYLGWGMWLHANVEYEDMWRPGASLTGGVGGLMQSSAVLYLLFIAAWPVWWVLHRRNRRGEVIVQRTPLLTAQRPLPMPSEFSDPSVA